MDSESPNLHMLFFPLMAPGHMIPMVDMAKLFAERGVKVTLVTTPANAPLIQSTIDHRAPQHHPIRLVLIPFPSAAAGLPEGCENLASVPVQGMEFNFMKAVAMLRQPFDQVLKEHLPDCIVSDNFLPGTLDVASELGIPRLVFHGTGFFSLCVSEILLGYKPHESLPSDVESSFVVPGLPHRIELLKSQMPDFHNSSPDFVEVFIRMKKAEMGSYGVVVNSFYELEPDYAEHYRSVLGRKAWHVGPVSLCNPDIVDKAARGDKSSIERGRCLNWLDNQRPGSVVYACFGSLCQFIDAQLQEIALGLEASHHPFIWVVREVSSNNASEWLPEGLEERIEEGGKGLIIRGWAPQILVLNHRAVGGFMTHCGWNSSLEGVSAGVPMITWPLFADQFHNERLVVDVLGIGIGIGIKKYAMLEKDRELVKGEIVEKAVTQLMAGGEEMDVMRKRARELGEMAKRAMEEGGSSDVDMGNLIEELIDRKKTLGKQ